MPLFACSGSGLVPSRVNRAELLDDPAAVANYLDANLRDIRHLNRWFGALRTIDALCAPFLLDRCSVLDVATGSADIPIVLRARAARRGVRIEVTGLDRSAEVLRAAAATSGAQDIRLVQGDALKLPFPDQSYDVVMCNLALHHFSPPDAIRVLREMARVARRAVIVLDLERSYLGYLGVWAATRTVARNRLTRHDGPLSVLRAYTREELAALARDAGLSAGCIRRHPFFRLSLVAPLND